MEFSDFSAFIRGYVNGTMSLAGLLLIVMFGHYVWRNRASFWHNGTTQVATAILILVTGHCVRATSSWIEFSMIRAGVDLAYWAELTWIWFLISAALVIWGKTMMLYWFSPGRWIWLIIGVGIPACLVVPALTWWLLG